MHFLRRLGRSSHVRCRMSTAPVAPAAIPVLDREAFKQVLTLPALRVPKAKCNDIMKRFRG